MQIITTITIAQGASESSPSIDLSGTLLVGVITPAGIEGDTLIFSGSIDNTNFFPVFDDAGTPARVEMPLAVSRWTGLSAAKSDALRGVRYLKIQALTDPDPQVQAAARTVTLILAR